VVFLLCLGGFQLKSLCGATFAPTAEELKRSPRPPTRPSVDLSTLPLKQEQGRTFVEIDDMRLLVGEGLDSAFAGNRWTNGIVYYVFEPGVSTFNRQRWRAAAAEWSAVAALTFIESTGSGNYIYVKNSTVNQSWLGMIGGQQTMEISDWDYKFIIAHEIGHALGLEHEHSRTGRDSYITILWNNIQDGNDSAFYIYPTTNYGTYDFDSVMHYDKCAFSRDCSEGFACNCTNYTIVVRPPNDVQWQDRIGQTTHISQLDGFGMAQRYGNVGSLSLVATADFNDDAFTDYLLFDSSTRRIATWHLQGNAFLSEAYGPISPAAWVVAAVADFNRDTKSDYVFFNSSTRQTGVWYLDNGTVLSTAYGPTLPAGWTLIAAVDFNNDGKPDYVLFKPSTRQTAIWYLNGTSWITGAYGPTLPAGWTLIDAIDFNSNSKPDFLLFRPSTRQTAIWYLNGAAFAAGAYGPTLPGGWALQGAADFNANAKPDYVLFQASTRRTAIWYLNGATFVGSAYGPTLPAGF
jgi:hypothetical protein